MPKLTDKPHTLYITHGGLLTLKILTRQLNPHDYHWVVIYDVSTCDYHFDRLTTVKLYDENGLEISDLSKLRFSSHQELMKFISRYAEKVHSIALDANLSEVAGGFFSRVTHEIAILAECEEAIFFTDTPLCYQDAENYINYQHMEFKPPVTLRKALVSNRAGLSAVKNAIFMEINHPKVADSQPENTAILMNFRPKRRGHHSLYITHGDISIVEGLMSKLSSNEHHWFVFYNRESKQYHLHNSTTVTLYDHNGRLVDDVSVLRFPSHHTLLEYIGGYAEGIRGLIIDANLSNATEDLFSEAVHEILALTECEEVVFLTDSMSCHSDTEKYLDHRHDTLKPPLPLKRAQLSMRISACSVRETVFIQVNPLNIAKNFEAEVVKTPIKKKPMNEHDFWRSPPSPERPKKSWCCFPISFFCRKEGIMSHSKVEPAPLEAENNSVTAPLLYSKIGLPMRERIVASNTESDSLTFKL